MLTTIVECQARAYGQCLTTLHAPTLHLPGDFLTERLPTVQHAQLLVFVVLITTASLRMHQQGTASACTYKVLLPKHVWVAFLTTLVFWSMPNSDNTRSCADWVMRQPDQKLAGHGLRCIRGRATARSPRPKADPGALMRLLAATCRLPCITKNARAFR